MKILFKIISAFLYFNAVSPVLMYYIYDDNPNIGFMALDNGIGAYVKTGFSVNGKKQFTGSYNPKYQKITNEHVVDSHFKVMKTPSKYSPPTIMDNARLRAHEAGKSNAQRIVEEYRNTEAPKQWQQRTQHQQPGNAANSGSQEPQNTQTPNNPSGRVEYAANTQEAAPHTQPSNNQQISPIRPKADYTQLKQRSQKQDGVFEPKPSFVQMNVRKTQITTDPQKIVRLNNNRQLTSLSVHTSQEKRQRIPTSMVMDKTLHKTNGLHEHNMEVMSRVLDDMTQKIADRRHKGEFRKRDTTKTLDMFEKSKRSVLSDNMRKYIGKDKSMGTHRAMDLARIGSREESLEINETPYALFYRMNPETLDQQEGFMIMRSVEENASRDFSSKEKRLSAVAYDDKSKKRQQKSKKNGNTLKLRKKLKNFSNYRNH
uniref:Uncharacterized protein n=1 Tax=Heliothis virescens TaxID=7102 RepID=A0A2A4K513_HELVI